MKKIKYRDIFVNFFAVISILSIFSIMALVISDKGAEITMDGYPTTSKLTYIILAITTILFTALSKITGIARVTFECPYCHYAISCQSRPSGKNSLRNGTICPHCHSKIYLLKKEMKNPV